MGRAKLTRARAESAAIGLREGDFFFGLTKEALILGILFRGNPKRINRP